MNTKKTDHMNRYFFDSPKNETQMEILRDLLWTLYSKLDAVLQGHRFILNVVERISRVFIIKGRENNGGWSVRISVNCRALIKLIITSQ